MILGKIIFKYNWCSRNAVIETLKTLMSWPRSQSQTLITLPFLPCFKVSTIFILYMPFEGSGTARRTNLEFGKTHVVRPKGKHQATIVWLHGLGDNGLRYGYHLFNSVILCLIFFYNTVDIVLKRGCSHYCG